MQPIIWSPVGGKRPRKLVSEFVFWTKTILIWAVSASRVTDIAVPAANIYYHNQISKNGYKTVNLFIAHFEFYIYDKT
jgi:hypothetical protein